MTELQTKLQEAILLHIEEGLTINDYGEKLYDLNIPLLLQSSLGLGSVIFALNHKFRNYRDRTYMYLLPNIMVYDGGDMEYICDRELLNENGTEKTLFEQSDDTQKVIAELLGVTLY